MFIVIPVLIGFSWLAYILLFANNALTPNQVVPNDYGSKGGPETTELIQLQDLPAKHRHTGRLVIVGDG
jgi:hypothetical protein